MISTIYVSANDKNAVAQALAKRIQLSLDNGLDVAWFVSGGSCIDVAVAARELLDLSNTQGILHIALIDERFGDLGHKDSNWAQLKAKNFSFSDVVVHPVLSGIDQALTTLHYDKELKEVLSLCNDTIGLLGMGADGHTSGLLPRNPLMDATNYVGTYEGPDYQRITTTPAFLKNIDTCFLYAVGAAKWPKLEAMNTETNASELPVLILKDCEELMIYTDLQGDWLKPSN
jgi:6-phosphogluconolactonase/glucosamine-6-phosphate isomerase/deaminase